MLRRRPWGSRVPQQTSIEADLPVLPGILLHAFVQSLKLARIHNSEWVQHPFRKSVVAMQAGGKKGSACISRLSVGLAATSSPPSAPLAMLPASVGLLRPALQLPLQPLQHTHPGMSTATRACLLLGPTAARHLAALQQTQSSLLVAGQGGGCCL